MQNLLAHKLTTNTQPSYFENLRKITKNLLKSTKIYFFRYLELHGLHTVGIFRVGTSKKRVRQVRIFRECEKKNLFSNGQSAQYFF